MFSTARYDTFKNVKSDCYIAKKLGVKEDDSGNEYPYYDKPNEEPYEWNIQPLEQSSENMAFGEDILRMKLAVITGEEKDKYINAFNEYDLAYLDGATPENESINGENANYRIFAVQSQNVALLIYFKKIK